ncbi:hypothetical protein [Mangrovicoccus sp. HB161399]|uniref:hypothetical protein n=1 Tax=Mangrovicoccus sp. HB161399 TaxID=2720392 RepID=UPI001554FC57|nr:hypothetical protein [Mangrovicoccus sp. HB161399]
MTGSAAPDLVLVGQKGRVGCEALLCLASLRASDPGFAGQIWLAEPQPGPLWPADPRMEGDLRAACLELGAELLPFDSRHFGAAYPQGNKIEALAALPAGRPFLFLDSDMLVLPPLSGIGCVRPTASDRVRDTWPKPPPFGPDRTAIWDAVFALSGTDRASTLDPRFPPGHPRRDLYLNAGWVAGPCARRFGLLWAEVATAIRDRTPPELAAQALDPWLDQIALPVVLARLGGGRPREPLDGTRLWHYRTLALLYATAPEPVVDLLERAAAPNRIKKHLKRHKSFHRAIWRGDGARARALFRRDRLPASEAVIRNRLRAAGLWLR